MKIIITGSEGLIGTSIKNYLCSQGHSCSLLDIKLGMDLTDENFVKKYLHF